MNLIQVFSDAGEFTLDNVRELPKDVVFVFAAFAIIAIFNSKYLQNLDHFKYLFQLVMSFFNGSWTFFNQLQWSSSQSVTQLSVLKISIVDNLLSAMLTIMRAFYIYLP